LLNEKEAAGLFASNPFAEKPPKYIRAVLYHYSFAKPGNPNHLWWNRERLGLWIQPLSTKDSTLVNFLKSEEWIR